MQEITQNSQPKNKSIPMMEFDVDDFEFKPITKGLGFHHGKEKTAKPTTYTRPSERPVKRTAPATTLPKTEIQSVTLDLPKVKKTNKVERKKVKTESVKTARLGVLLTSFVFDLILLTSFQVSLSFAFMKLVGLTDLVEFIKFTWMEQTAFFAFSYLFYFTIMDLVASPGKRIFNLRLKSTVDDKVSIDQTLIRSVVSFCSFFLCLMPLLFDFQGKLSDTKVIEDA